MKKILLIVMPILVLTVVMVVLSQPGKDTGKNIVDKSEETLTPVNNITHGHGLAIDRADANKVYIATHHGLLLLQNDKDLFQVGTATDDYMGFSAHPTDSNVFFSSGHPTKGGNIGFQKSEDGALSWKKVSDGVGGPVDFHAMTISPANPNLVYGYYQGAVQRSLDQGKTWEKLPVDLGIINFAADYTDENIVYAATQQGLFVSKDKAQTWTSVLEATKSGVMTALSIDPQNTKNLLAYSDKMGLIRSEAGSATWTQIKTDFAGEIPLYITLTKNAPNIGYLLTEKNSIYKTTDNGTTWNKVY
jgi:photosystem II stability/assembly factor-like uncharacterized protein